MWSKLSAILVDLSLSEQLLIGENLFSPVWSFFRNSIREHPIVSDSAIILYNENFQLYERLNHLMILHVHKEKTDTLVLTDVANEFVSKSECREQVFGKF